MEDREEQEEITPNYNDGRTNHRGVVETLNQLKKRYYWLNMSKVIVEVLAEC